MDKSLVESVEQRILTLVADKPMFFMEISEALGDVEYRSILQAFGNLRRKKVFDRDIKGRYLLAKQ